MLQSLDSEWLIGLCSVIFDIDEGQKVLETYPPGLLSPDEATNVAFHAFPVPWLTAKARQLVFTVSSRPLSVGSVTIYFHRPMDCSLRRTLYRLSFIDGHLSEIGSLLLLLPGIASTRSIYA